MDLVLIEPLCELAAVCPPPCPIEFRGEHLDHHDIISLAVAIRRDPHALRRRPRVGGDAGEGIHQFLTRPGKSGVLNDAAPASSG